MPLYYSWLLFYIKNYIYIVYIVKNNNYLKIICQMLQPNAPAYLIGMKFDWRAQLYVN